MGYIVCPTCDAHQSCNPNGKIRKHKHPKTGESCAGSGKRWPP